MNNKTNRSTQIIRTSWIGIAANVLLAAFKTGVGIVGTKLSQRPAELQPLVPGMQVVVVVDHNYSE
jgi:hypothetical protein